MSKKKTMVIWWQEYALVKIAPKDAINRHHIIWKKNEVAYHINSELNKILIKERKHCALNNLVWEKQSPHEQLKLMLEIWEPVLSETVRDALYEILSLPRWEFYKKELVKKKYQNKDLFSNKISDFYNQNNINNEWL